MNCKEALPLMHEYLDGDLNGSAATELKKHLLQCPSCKEHLNELEQAEALTRSMPRITAPDDLADRIMKALPGPRMRTRWLQWIRQHPAVTAASVFLLVMFGSFMSIWNQDRELVVKGADLEQVVIHGDTVYVPAGHTVNGNLMVQGGRVEVAGEVKGNLVVVDGSYSLASTAKIAGQIKQVDQALEWLWFKVSQMASAVTP